MSSAVENSTQSHLLPWMIGVSLAVHAVLLPRFWGSHVPRTVTKRGVIAVDFIEAVHHEPQISVNNGKTRADKKQEAKKDTPTPPQMNQAPQDPNSVQKETSAYIMAVARLINARKIYPKEALDREEEGRVVVGITISATGEVLDSKVEEPANFSSLNDAALKTVAATGKFPPVPPGVGLPLHLHIPLVFKVERN